MSRSRPVSSPSFPEGGPPKGTASLLSGNTVLESLDRQGFNTVFIDAQAPDFCDRVRTADTAFLAIAGQYAEDGKLQGLLETLNVPYTGSGVLASAMGMHKATAKAVVATAGVPVLPHAVVATDRSADVAAKSLASNIPLPVILKPQSEGGSIGMRVCHDITELVETFAAIDHGDDWLVEPFAAGTPVTAAVLETDGIPVVLPVLSTLPTSGEFYDYEAKRNETLHRYQCPADLPNPISDRIAEAALTAHQALGCKGYSRSDFIVADDGRVLWLEINTLPGLSRHGNLATMAAAGGIEYDGLVRMILATASTVGGYRP